MPPFDIPTVGEKLSPVTVHSITSLEFVSFFEETPFQAEIESCINTDLKENLQQNSKQYSLTGTYLEYHIPLSGKKIDKSIPFVLTRFSSIKGLPYYSISHQKYRILFEEIYRIDFNSSYSRLKGIPSIPDPTLDEISHLKKPLFFRFFQKDSALGSSIWKSTFIKGGEKDFYLYYTNETVLTKWGSNLIDPLQMKMFFTVKQDSQFLVLKAAVVTNMNAPLFLKSRIEKSLVNRLNATAWYLCSNLFEKPFVPAIVKSN